MRERAVTPDVRKASAVARHGRSLETAGARAVALAAQVSLRLDARSVRIELPQTPNTWIAVGAREMLWLGPDEWLVVSETEPAETVLAELEAATAADHHAIVDVSANRAVLELTGPDRRELLAAGCGIDLHPRAWRTGMCAQTLLANVAVLLQERDEATRLFLRPSYAGHLGAWLGRVARVR
jgi:sarcosine oxidase subunit gamma